MLEKWLNAARGNNVMKVKCWANCDSRRLLDLIPVTVYKDGLSFVSWKLGLVQKESTLCLGFLCDS